MAYRTMPFGFSRGHVVQVQAPLSGMTKAPTGYNEVVEFGNGGATVQDSAGKHSVYQMSYDGDASKLDGLEVFQEFSSGLWGKGLLHFSDPMNYDQNLLPPHWATPHLAELGWKNPILGTATFANAAPTEFMPYARQATYAITMAANAVPTHVSKIATILVPPTHKLWLGFKGVSVGTARLMAVPILPTGVAAAAVPITLLPPTDNQILSSAGTIDGATYQAVEIYATRTSDATTDVSTLTLNAATARLFPRGITPLLTGRHIPGKGHTGVRFGDSAIAETYKMVRGHKKQLSTTLVEVGAWL